LVTDVTVPEGADTIDYRPKDRFVNFLYSYITYRPVTLNKNTGDVDAILSCQCLIHSEECYVTRLALDTLMAGLHVLYETTDRLPELGGGRNLAL